MKNQLDERCEHLIIDHDGVRPFPHLSPAQHKLYDILLEDPFRVISTRELEARMFYTRHHIGECVIALRRILEKEGLGTIHSRKAVGYYLREKFPDG